MATNNAINLSAAGLANYDGAGTFTGVTITNNAALTGGSSNSIVSTLLTNGQLLIGSTGAAPNASTLTAGTGVSITNGAGSITINSTGGGLTWTDVSGISQTMAPNNGYLADNAALVTLTLPVVCPQFSSISIVGFGAGGWTVAQNAGQSIQFGKFATTSGVTGSLSSTNQYDCIELICVVANTTFVVRDSVGNITIV